MKIYCLPNFAYLYSSLVFSRALMEMFWSVSYVTFVLSSVVLSFCLLSIIVPLEHCITV